MKKFRIWESAALLALCIALCLAVWAQGRQNSMSERLLRLHVVAVSNDAYEQELKLRVRDAVLEYISPRLEDAENAEQAQQIVRAELDGIAGAAAAVAEGRAVSVSIGEENYPTKSYEGFSLPAGKYRSLRVVLGEGQGENWWCVVFPPVCLSAAQTDELRNVMSEDELEIITDEGNYVLRFKILEIWGEIAGKFTK